MIVPSVDVRAGRVAYRGGVGADVAPRDLAARYVQEGADELHLVDLDGAERGDFANAELLAEIARASAVPCRLAGGISSIEKAREAIAAGFAGVLFSSAVFGDETLLRRVAHFGDRAIIEIEAKDGVLAPRGGDPDLVRRAAARDALEAASAAVQRGVRALYVIDVTADRRFGGPPLELMDRLRAKVGTGPGVALHTGGGVRDLDDVRALARWGAASVVIGRAFLDRRFTLAEAKAACA
ncbi:MAG TPA: HisA/HisF-related TIM barrel protein [Candidatus Limnocylindria bacterium]|nr:HisA/HisF-related TIM barrel protein [Candidatus Limnocylindria bacterium]